MKRALAILLGVAMVCLVAYVSWLNPATVEFRFTPTRSVQPPLAVLMVLAFVTGVTLMLAMVMIQAGRRAFVTWRQERQQRRLERLDDWEARGEELIWKGDAPRGRALLQKAWQQRPHNAHALLALATSFSDTGELERARQLLRDAAGDHSTNPEILFALAETHRAVGDHAAATAALERLHALHPASARVLRALRQAYVEAGRWADATALQEALVRQLRETEQAARERITLMILRYQSALHVADPAHRVQALEALADSRAGSVPVWVSLGDALVASARHDEASAVWERALRTQPRTVFVERLASIATEERHRDRLRTLLRKLRSDQVRPDMLHLLTAQLHLQDGNVDQAARELESLQSPGVPALQRLWGDVHRRRGHLDEALHAYTTAEPQRPPYRCKNCGHGSPEWEGHCAQCGHWDSYRSETEISAT